MIQLCQREWNILTFIEQYIATNGVAPTIREIQLGTGIPSASTIWHHLADMESAGVLTWQRQHNRTIVLHRQSVGVAL